MAQQSIVTTPIGTPGAQQGVVTDQAATRATLSGIAANPFATALGYSQLQTLLTSAQNAQIVAQQNLVLAQDTQAAAVIAQADAQAAFNANPTPATLVALNTANNALAAANDHVTDVNNQVNSFGTIITQVQGVNGLNTSVGNAQATAVAPLSTAIAAYNGGLVPTTTPTGTPTGGNLEGIMSSVSAIPANPNQGYQPGDVANAGAALTLPGFSVNAADYIINVGPNAGLLNNDYANALVPVVNSVSTEYNNYLTGLNTATQNQVLANMGNQSWERAAFASITDGTGSLNVNNLTANTVNAGNVVVGGVANIHTVGNDLHLGTDSIVLSQQGGGVNYDTISTSSGNLNLQNGTVTISQAGNVGVGGDLTVAGATTLNGGLTVNGATTLNGDLNMAGNNISGANNITATGTIQGGTLSDGAGTTISGGVVTATTVNATDVNATTVNATDVNATGTVKGGAITDGTATLTGGRLSIVRSGSTVTVIDTQTGGITTINADTGNITTVNAQTGNINTVNAVTGNIQTVNAHQINVGDGTYVNASISQAGVITGTSLVAPSLTLHGYTVTGIQDAPALGTALANFGASSSTLATSGYAKRAAAEALYEANAYTLNRYQKLNRGIAMTAALETPTIEPGKYNALKVSASGYEGSAGLSLGYARRLSGAISADISAATSADWKEAVVRGGINWSF